MGAQITYCCHRSLTCVSCGRFTGRVKRHSAHKEKTDDDDVDGDADEGETGEKGAAQAEKETQGICSHMPCGRCCSSRKKHKHEYHHRVRVRSKDDDFRFYCGSGDVPHVQRMLDKSMVDVNTATQGGYRGTHAAAYHGHVAALSLLMDRKGDMNALTTGGLSPLMLAAANGQASLVEFLLNSGVSVVEKADSRRGSRQAHDFATGFGNEELGKLIKGYLPKKEGSDAGSRSSAGSRGSSRGGKSHSNSSGSQRSVERFQPGTGGARSRKSVTASAAIFEEDGESST